MPYKDPERQRQYMREWVSQRRRDYLADKSCAICGSTDRMEVDHIDRATKVDHRIWSWSKTRRDAELAKCQVLCNAHHLEKTATESRGVSMNVGTENAAVKLTPEQVLAIRASRLTGAELGKLYGVHATTANKVRRGAAWKHLAA